MTLRARETFFVGNTKITIGQLLSESDPIVKGKAHLFVTVPDDMPHVEQATAAPGQKRSVSVPAKKKVTP